MLHLSNNLKYLSQALETVPQINTNLQIIRWARKPLWMPTAKSKVFRIPVKPTVPIEEKEEIKRLKNNYNTYVKSLEKFLFEKYNVKFQTSLDPKLIQEEFDRDFERCSQINNQWNEEQRVKREARVAEEVAKEIEYAKQRLEMELEKEIKLEEIADEIVRKEKAIIGTFITPEKLDEAIEFAIANPVDYNFAIDLDGNKIIGRETKPPIQKKEVNQ